MLGSISRALVGVSEEYHGLLLDILNKLQGRDHVNFYDNLKQFVRDWKAPVHFARDGAVIYLDTVFTTSVNETTGSFDYTTAEAAFRKYFSPKFAEYGIIFSGIAEYSSMTVRKLIQDGTFLDFIGNTAAVLEERRVLGAQFLDFCMQEQKWNIGGAKSTGVFVLTRGDEPVSDDLSNVYVAMVNGSKTNSRADIFPISDPRIVKEKSRIKLCYVIDDPDN